MGKYATINPATGEVVQGFDTMSDADADQALTRAHEAYLDWRNIELKERAAVLGRVADLFRQNATDLAELTTLEMGKPITQAKGEVELSAAIFDYYATKGLVLLADEVLDIAGSGRAIVRTAPIGPLLGIMPWNFPYYQAARFVAPNLLLGNTILLKHAAICPQQALRLAELLDVAGAPVGVYQNVFATTDQVATMIASPLLQGVSLTGSERAGSAVGELAGRHLKKAVLELGGSDPFIVLPGADIGNAVSAAVAGRFGNAGQVCTSSKRMIVESSVFDEFLHGFVTKADQWRLGDPTSEDTKLGPMASVAARSDLIDQVDSVDEAITLANDSPYGLGGAVFTGDLDQADDVANRLDVGMVGLNTTVKSAPDLPFGGVKNSGIGRELGRFGLDEFANKKLVRII